MTQKNVNDKVKLTQRVLSVCKGVDAVEKGRWEEGDLKKGVKIGNKVNQQYSF